eukprot:TRINITY_DN3331_c0_g1_i1.p1 TRINITY_DN3331_c0_g1~~TRINITY_DN3331_c0_g1_i1.p1  ORF type:complete len:422 (-),score=95.28 TRINITY_DN3331_c0_g1_i1:95-1360(-)
MLRRCARALAAANPSPAAKVDAATPAPTKPTPTEVGPSALHYRPPCVDTLGAFQNNILGLTKRSHIARFLNTVYTLSKEEEKALHPEPWNRQVAEMFGALQCHFLYRPATMMLDIYLTKLRNWQKKKDVLRELRNEQGGFIVSGKWGTGKSTVLQQAVHLARSRNILTFYIPDAAAWTSNSYVEPSLVLPGAFDAPVATREFLENTLKANAELLDALPYNPPQNLPLADDENMPVTLKEWVTWGLREWDRLGLCLKTLLDELLRVDSIPIVFVVDGYNHLLRDTEYSFGPPVLTHAARELPRVHAKQLTLVRGLNRLIQAVGSEGKENILVLAAPSFTADREEAERFRPETTPLCPIEVLPYTPEEFRAMLGYYLSSGALNQPSEHMPSFDRLLYKTEYLSKRNPREVYKNYLTCPIWFYP